MLIDKKKKKKNSVQRVILKWLIDCASKFRINVFPSSSNFQLHIHKPTIYHPSFLCLRINELTSVLIFVLRSSLPLLVTNTTTIVLTMAIDTIGIIGMGDMGKMYANRISSAGWK